jgi:threonine dehydrogenase-like Zn-dependent dehydrogenase
MARNLGAEVIDCNAACPVWRIQQLTGGIGVDRAIDAASVDAMAPLGGPRVEKEAGKAEARQDEVREIAPETYPRARQLVPGDAPSEVLKWAVAALAKAGEFAIVGVYPETAKRFPIGEAMMKNLAARMGKLQSPQVRSPSDRDGAGGRF